MKKKTEIRYEYEVRTIDAHGDAIDTDSFEDKAEAVAEAESTIARLNDEGHGVVVERVTYHLLPGTIRWRRVPCSEQAVLLWGSDETLRKTGWR